MTTSTKICTPKRKLTLCACVEYDLFVSEELHIGYTNSMKHINIVDDEFYSLSLLDSNDVRIKRELSSLNSYHTKFLHFVTWKHLKIHHHA